MCGAAAVIGEVERPANDCAAPFFGGLFASCDITRDDVGVVIRSVRGLGGWE